jgi:hypothetical protein
MLVLPTGQVLYTDGSNDVEIYTAVGNPYPGLAPTALIITSGFHRGQTYRLFGNKFNGASQTNFYGDDAQAATNYPLVRLVNRSTGHVFYCRTHDHSTMAVGFEGPTYTYFDVPANMESGASYLEVVVNGIASRQYLVGVL